MENKKWTMFRMSRFHNWKIDTGDNWFTDCGIDGEETAKLIVKCVNSHDDLTSLFRQCYNLLSNELLHSDGKDMTDMWKKFEELE